MILDASNKEELQTIIKIRGIQNIIYVKSLREIVSKYEQTKEIPN